MCLTGNTFFVFKKFMVQIMKLEVHFNPSFLAGLFLQVLLVTVMAAMTGALVEWSSSSPPWLTCARVSLTRF